MTKVLLIGPTKKITDQKFGIKNLSRLIGPSLGLLSIGTLLKNNGVKVKYFCPDLYYKNWQKTLSRAISSGFDFVGIANTAYTIENDLKIAHFIKKLSPKTTIIAGGYFSQFFPEVIFKHTDVDIVIRGDGEFPFLEIIKGKPLGKIPGVCFRNKEKIFIKDPYFLTKREFFKLPPLDFSLYPYKKAWKKWPLFKREIDFYTSKGCPFSCRFCSVPILNNYTMRFLPLHTIKNMLIQAEKTGARKIFIVDPNFTANRKHLSNVCNLIIKLKQEGIISKKLYFLAQARIELLEKNILQIMKRAGFRWVFLGIENISPYLLKDDINKKCFLNKRQILRQLKLVLKSKIKPYVYLIPGTPQTTIKELKENLSFALTLKRIGIKIEVNPFVIPYPETEYYQIYKNTPFISWRKIVLWRVAKNKNESFSLRIPDTLYPKDPKVKKLLTDFTKEANILAGKRKVSFAYAFLRTAQKVLCL